MVRKRHLVFFDLDGLTGWRLWYLRLPNSFILLEGRVDGGRNLRRFWQLLPVSTMTVGSRYEVYEWQARKAENCNEKMTVLDIGSTCNVHPESSRDRVKEYRTKRSQTADLINDTSTMEYELWFRVKMPKIGSLLKTWRTSFLIAMITRRM